MTLPCERYRAVGNTRDYLTKLLHTEDPMVPKWVKNEAYDCLRHYPGSFDMEKTKENDPNTWGEEE